MRSLMKSLFAAAVVAALFLFGSTAVVAGDHCPAAVKVQTVTVAQPVIVAQPVVVAAPVYVVPSAPTVAIQQVYAAPVVQAVTVPTVVRPVILQQRVVQQKVVQQRAPVVRSFSIQRVRVR